MTIDKRAKNDHLKRKHCTINEMTLHRQWLRSKKKRKTPFINVCIVKSILCNWLNKALFMTLKFNQHNGKALQAVFLIHDCFLVHWSLYLALMHLTILQLQAFSALPIYHPWCNICMIWFSDCSAYNTTSIYMSLLPHSFLLNMSSQSG